MRWQNTCPIALGGMAAVLITGCASTAPQTSQFETNTRAQPNSSTGHADLYGLDGGADELIEPTGVLDLEQAVALSLRQNPELVAFSHEMRAADGRLRQAKLIPNPAIGFEVEEYDRDGLGFDSAETSVAVAQLFELGGKRRQRTRVAEAEGELAGWDYTSKRLEVISATTLRFAQVVIAQRRVALATSVVELAQRTHDAVNERVKAGKEPPLQSSKAGAELEMARIAVLEAQNELNSDRSALASTWGSARPTYQAASGDLDTISASVPSLETLRSRLQENPDLARWDNEIQLSQAVLASEKAARIPDVEAAIGLQRFEEDGTDSLAFGIGVPLPLFDRNQGNITAATHGLQKSAALRAAAETSLTAQLVEAHALLTSSHKTVATLQKSVVPAMEEAFAAAHEGYQQGKFGFLDMLDAQRGLFEARGAYVDALSDYHTALANIQRLTGTRIEEIRESDSGEQR